MTVHVPPPTLTAALAYIRKGWSPIPIPHGCKGPTIPKWNSLVIDENNVSSHFRSYPQNIGVMLGKVSGGLTDVDLDCSEAILLASSFLPKTDAIFGRETKPSSHYLYLTDLAKTEKRAAIKFLDPSGSKSVILEIRLGGASAAQTVFPPSRHPSGEVIEWAVEGEPFDISSETLTEQCSRLAAACLLARYWGKEGNRNEHRMALAASLLRGKWSVDEVAHFVNAVTCAAGGMSDLSARLTEAKSAADRIARSEPTFGRPKLVALAGEDVVDCAFGWLSLSGFGTPSALLPKNEITEDSVAQVFADRFSAKMRHDHTIAKWFCWDGYSWRRDETGLVIDTIRSLARELASKTANGTHTKLAGRSAFVSGVEKLAKCDRKFAVTFEAWDPDPMLLGTPEGTVDLRTGECLKSEPLNSITKLTSVGPSDHSDCKLWYSFLNSATGGDGEMVRFLQQWCGYCLSGDTREHALLFVYGQGGNGKSVFLNTIQGVLGDYSQTAAMETFTASKYSSHPTELAQLKGARLVTAAETEEGRAWAESRIKQLTGGDKISARFMRQNFFTFLPEFKLLIAGNHKPALQNVDEATRRRFNIVPFVHKPLNPDKELEAKLKLEWPGILRWMIEGCRDWQENGLVRSSSVTEATNEYFDDQDVFGQWLADHCVVNIDSDELKDTVAVLFEDWSAYATSVGEDAGTMKSFSSTMKKRGFRPGRTSSGRLFRGIYVKRKPSNSWSDG